MIHYLRAARHAPFPGRIPLRRGQNPISDEDVDPDARGPDCVSPRWVANPCLHCGHIAAAHRETLLARLSAHRRRHHPRRSEVSAARRVRAGRPVGSTSAHSSRSTTRPHWLVDRHDQMIRTRHGAVDSMQIEDARGTRALGVTPRRWRPVRSRARRPRQVADPC